MATELHNLSEYDPAAIPSAEGMRFGIVVSEWNQDITSALLNGAISALRTNGVPEDNILVRWVPGSFELTAGARCMALSGGVDAVICLGCVIRGDTPHFDYVCQGATQGITALNATLDKPVIFGLLTTDNKQQALDRCGGRLGNKGTECAITAIKMADYIWKFRK